MTLSRDTGDFGRFGVNQNLLINGQMSIWQRWTTVNVGVIAYTADRFAATRGSGGSPAMTASRVDFDPDDMPNEIDNVPMYAAYLNQTALASAEYPTFEQRIEHVTGTPQGTITISFLAKANTSAVVVRPSIAHYYGIGGSSSVETMLGSVSVVAGSWAKYVMSLPVPTLAGKTITTATDYASIILNLPLDETFQIYITNFKVESGPMPTPYVRRPMSALKALCHRYYWQSYKTGDERGDTVVSPAFASHLDAAYSYHPLNIAFPQTMRAAPSTTIYDLVGGSGAVSLLGATLQHVSSGACSVVSATTNGILGINLSVADDLIGGHFWADAEL